MHSFNSCLAHCIWSTKNRTPFLTSDLRERLWPYLGGIAKQNKMKPLAVGGAADHVHMLIALPAALSVAKAIQLLKGNSSVPSGTGFLNNGCPSFEKLGYYQSKSSVCGINAFCGRSDGCGNSYCLCKRLPR